MRDFRNERHSIWGITARNREQNFALNLLLDPEIDFVTILGPAGTGKTLLTLAAGLAQTLESNRYSEIIMTRVTIPLGEDIGFLPGTEEEKMEPWMGALMDNLEVLTQSQEGGNWGRAATNDLLRNRIKIRSLNFMRGRTFLNRYLILDEAQNLTPKQMKALVTRAGPGTKLVCLGNIAQIDTPYLTETTSRPDLRREPVPRLAALRPHHADARRAFAPGRLRVRDALARPRGTPLRRAGLMEHMNAQTSRAQPAGRILGFGVAYRPAEAAPGAGPPVRAARDGHGGPGFLEPRRRDQDRPHGHARPARTGPGGRRSGGRSSTCNRSAYACRASRRKATTISTSS